MTSTDSAFRCHPSEHIPGANSKTQRRTRSVRWRAEARQRFITWALLLAGLLTISLSGCATTADQTATADATTSDGPLPTAEQAPTTQPDTTQTSEVPDLTGRWQAVKTVQGESEAGVVLISQSGMSFTLSFDEGFECKPAEACEFEGTIETLQNDAGTVAGYVWMASNNGAADNEGGTFESFFGLQPASEYSSVDDLPSVDVVTGEEIDLANSYFGVGQSIYHAPGFADMVWETSLWISP